MQISSTFHRPCYFGGFADGTSESVKFELTLNAVEILCESTCGIAFRFTRRDCIVGCFVTFFQLLHSSSVIVQDEPFTLESLNIALRRTLPTHTDIVLERLRAATAWRITVIRQDDASCRQNFKTKDIEDMMGSVLRCSLRAGPTDTLASFGLPPISLTTFSLELIVWIRKGTLAIGFRTAETNKIHAACLLDIQKPEGRTSRACDYAAFCVVAQALKEFTERQQLPNNLIIADPMCGVGTFLVAAHRFLRCNFPDIAAQYIGADADPQSIACATTNAAATHDAPAFTFLCARCEELTSPAGPMPLNGADMILVDPPWGHRHSSWSIISRSMSVWARRWLAALKPGGVLAVTTIRRRQMEGQVLPRLQEEMGAALLRPPVVFDNSGFAQCGLYLFTKTRPTADHELPPAIPDAPAARVNRMSRGEPALGHGKVPAEDADPDARERS